LDEMRRDELAPVETLDENTARTAKTAMYNKVKMAHGKVLQTTCFVFRQYQS
jgi:hypothetical protein